MSVILEPVAEAFAEATAQPPFLYELDPVEGRKIVDDVQADPHPGQPGYFDPSLTEHVDLTVPGGPLGEVPVRITRPAGVSGPLPVILYIHGAGWVFGDEHTHDRLVRELSHGTGAAVVFPNYHLSPEAPYPNAIEENWTIARWVVEHGAEHELDPSRFVVAGDSVGGNMAAALTLMAKERGGVEIDAQVLFYPVTDAAFDTASYKEFAAGYFLSLEGMKWFWDQYTTDEAQRAEITASPLRATTEQLAGLPKALVINAEADVLRDEGEAYGRKLREAGVDVTQTRYGGMVHDFVMLNALRPSRAADAAIAQAIGFISYALGDRS
jgi:acetyl esterase/lipase